MHLDLNANERPGDVLLPVEVRVKQGMAVLDEKHGPEWVYQIDLETLEMSSTCMCVLGQMYGTDDDAGYYPGLEDLFGQGWTDSLPPQYGLDADLPAGIGYGFLRAEWKVQITRRRLELANG